MKIVKGLPSTLQSDIGDDTKVCQMENLVADSEVLLGCCAE